MPSAPSRRLTALALALALALAPPAAAQTWIGPGSDWNTASNWTPAVVPNSATATAVFTGADLGTVNISASVQAQTLAFLNPAGAYTLTSSAGQTLSGLTTIVVGTAVTGTETVNLANVATGSLVFTGAPTITNLSTSTTTTLVIGPNTVLGSANHAGLTFAGTGVTQISGSFATSGNTVTGGLVKTGPGTLLFTGSGAGLTGGLTLNGGTLQLDYSSNTAAKLGGGSLTLLGGQLALVANTATPVTQNVAGGTAVSAGHTDLVASSAGGGTIALGLGAITRSAGATLDVSTGSGAPALLVNTTAGNTNGLLGTGPAFATVGGLTWAVASGGGIAGLSAGGYGANTFTAGTNVDVTTSSSQSGFTANSLRFNTTPAATLTLSGTNTLQSGGILVTPSGSGGGTITGGTLTAGGGELIVHQYGGGSNFTINSDVVAANGLTKTGLSAATLTLGGNNVGLTGPVNVNRGHLAVTNTAAVNSASAINFNDARAGNSLQRFTVDLGNNADRAIAPPIRLSAFADADSNLFGTVFSTGASTGSRVALIGKLSSAPGLTTPVRFTGSGTNTSGFNLTNAANSFTGDVSLFQGFLGITADSALGNPANTLILDTFTATAGGLEFLKSGVTINRPVVINSSSRVVSNDSDDNTIAGTMTSAAGNRPLVKAGTGTLTLAGNGSGLLGGLTLACGTLKLDYSTNTAAKLGGGVLTLNGGVFNVVANTATPVTQNVAGGTAVSAGHTDLVASSAGGGTIALGLGAITRSAGATLDVSTGSGAPALLVNTTAGNTNGLLGTGPAFATFNGGATWATAPGGSLAAFSAYDTNNYATTSNTDVTQSATIGSAGVTVNSLRFNTGSPSLTLNGTLALQSGGILVTTGNAGGSITGGGTLSAGGSGELIVHQYDNGLAAFPINAAIAAAAGLTKTGPGTLTLGGNNTGLTGPVNVNRGGLSITAAAAVNSATAINFNDARDGSGASFLQVFTIDLGNGINATLNPPIRLSANFPGTRFTTDNSTNSRVTLAGVLSGQPGLPANVTFTGPSDNSSGFNLTAANTFTGTVQLLHGSLGIASDASLGNPANLLDLQVRTVTAGGLEFLNSGITLNRPVNVFASRIVSNGSDSNTIAGPVSGFDGFLKAGTGTLTLTNPGNTITGQVAVQAGTLSLGTAGRLADGTDVTVNAGATFNLPTAAALTLDTVTLNGGTFRMPGGSGTSTVVSQIVTNSAGGVIDYTSVTGANVVTIPAGSPGFTVAGDSTWLGPANGTAQFRASNTADTPIAISPGVTLTNGLALGTTNSFGYRVTGGGTLFQNADSATAAAMSARVTVVGSRFRVIDASSNGGVGNLGTGAFTLDGSTFAYGGPTATTAKPIALTVNGATIDIESAAATLTANGAITGPGGLTKTGPGTLVLGNGSTSFAGLTVAAGAAEAATDAALGANPVIPVAAAGTLRYTGTTTAARTFNLNFGTLAAGSGATVTLNGATVNGGFLRGPGAFVLTGGTALNGVTAFNSAVIAQSGPATLTNVTSGGTLTNAAGTTLTWNGGVNTSSGLFTVAGTANVSDWSSNGRVAVNPGGTLTNTQASALVLGGGSVTTIGIHNPATGQVTPGGTINIGAGDLRVQGGFVRNNGTITGTGNLIIDFGGLVKGAGDIDLPNAPIRINGGQLLAGNSPGLTRISNFSLVSTGATGGDFSNAAGTAGPPIGSTGTQLSGWSVFEYGNSTNTGGSAQVQGTPSARAIWRFRTVLDGGDFSTAGPPADFDPNRRFTWPVVRPRSAADAANPGNITPVNTVAQLSILDTATNATVPLTDANLNTYLRFDDSQWDWGSTPLAQRGTFSFELEADVLGAPDRVIAVVYTPVPEPAWTLVAGLAGLAGLAAARGARGRFVRVPPGRTTRRPTAA